MLNSQQISIPIKPMRSPFCGHWNQDYRGSQSIKKMGNDERWWVEKACSVGCQRHKMPPKFLLSRAKNSGDSSVFDELMMMGDSSSSSTKPQSFGISLFGGERSERCQSNNKTFEWTSRREWSWHQLEDRKERMTYDEDRSWLLSVDEPTCQFS
jgi:hypothetical protein